MKQTNTNEGDTMSNITETKTAPKRTTYIVAVEGREYRVATYNMSDAIKSAIDNFQRVYKCEPMSIACTPETV